MAKTRRLFLSDVHLGGDERASWFQKDRHEARLVAFLEWVAAQTDVKDLVLLGDLFDEWMWPMDQKPQALTTVIPQRHPAVLSAVKAAKAAVENVFYVNGNHDLGVSQTELDALFGAGVVKWITQYNAGLLYAEHGSRFGLFNARDRMHDPTQGLPLGYFITRLLAGTEVAYTSPGALLSFVDDLLEAMFTTQTLASSVIEAVAEVTGRGDDATVVMPGNRPPISVAQIKARYAPLVQRWVERFGPGYAINAIRAEGDGLAWFAKRLHKQQGFRVVVLGHTHHEHHDVFTDGLLGLHPAADAGTFAYLNSGYFCPSGNGRATVAEVDKRDDGYTARVLDLTNGVPPVVLREATISNG